MTAPDRERLLAYLDGELPPLERTAVERELESSEEARQLLAELAALDELARSQPVEAPEGYFDALPGRIRGRLEPGTARRRTVPAWTWAAAAAVAVAALAPLTLSRMDSAPPAAAVPPVTVLRDAEETVADAAPHPEADAEAGAADEPVAAPPSRVVASQEAPAAATPAPEAPRRIARPRAAEPDGRAERVAPTAEPPAPPAAAPVPADRDRRTSEDLAQSEAEGATAGQEATAPEGAAAGIASVLNEARFADTARDAPAEGAEAEPRVQPARSALVLERRQAAGVAVGADAERFTGLAARRPRTADEARALREDWRGFVMLYPESALADEGRVRTVEAGLEAWRLGDDPADRAVARRDAEAYLAREDAAQTGRVEALLAALEREP